MFLAKDQKQRHHKSQSPSLHCGPNWGQIFIILSLLLFVWRNYLTDSYIEWIISIHDHSFIRHTDAYNPYQLPGKSPPPIAAVTALSDENKDHGIYKGMSSPHLGGWTDFDPRGVSNMTWNYMIAILGVKSLLDIGCGRGYSTNYFLSKGVRVLCVEGSPLAVSQSHLPSNKYIIEHDYTLGESCTVCVSEFVGNYDST